MGMNKFVVIGIGVTVLTINAALVCIATAVGFGLPFPFAANLFEAATGLFAPYSGPAWYLRVVVAVFLFGAPLILMTAYAALKSFLLPRNVSWSEGLDMEMNRALGIGCQSVSFWFGTRGNFRDVVG